MIYSVIHTLHSWFRPSILALFKPDIPWNLRWRLLILQPLTLVSNAIGTLPYLFSKAYHVEYITIADVSFKALIFKPPGTGNGRLRPLHVDIHGGAFIGGLPENTAVFDERVAKETGAVVVSISYRLAPEHVFPAAIDDVDATIKWLRENAETRWGADPTLMTLSGSSAGGNLALAATQQKACQSPESTSIKAIVTFYASIDLRLKPSEKPRPASFPKHDPLAVMLPLYDAYASPVRAANMENPRMNPILAAKETLPPRILMVVPGVDILVAEQMAFAERVNWEGGNVHVFYEEKAFHGYLDLPDAIVKREVKDQAFDRGIAVLRETYAKYGWTWEV